MGIKSKLIFVYAMIAICAISFNFKHLGTFGLEKDDRIGSNTIAPLTDRELATLANKCLNVVKNELKNRDMPVAFTFLGITERVISAIGGNYTTEANNMSLTIQPTMCDWFDPESKTEIK